MDHVSHSETFKPVGRVVPLMLEKLLNQPYTFDFEEFRKILCNNEIKNKKIAVISILGSIRRGKSFLLNCILRYLFSKCTANWANNLEQPMEGFPWSSGPTRETMGISMWNEPFIMQVGNDDMVIIVIDTEGLFNRFSTYSDNVTIAALSLLMSSYQILYIDHSWDELTSDFMEVFINYATLIIDSWCIKNPFQNIMGIVSDWSNPVDSPYGLYGGDVYFNGASNSKSTNTENLQFKRYYKTLFNQFQCFMMPHPGFKASNNPNFDGRFRDLEPKFLEQLKILIPTIVSPDILSPKKINHHCLTCKEFFYYVKSLVLIINRPSFPRISDILVENGNVNKWELFEQMNDYYMSEIDKFVESEGNFVSDEKLLREHIRLSTSLKEILEKNKFFNSAAVIEQISPLIFNHLQSMQFRLAADNANKNMKMGILTPYALILLLALLYFFSHFTKYLNIKVISYVADASFYVSLSTVMLWIGSCWLQLEELSGILDELVDILILYIFNPFIILWRNKPAKLLNSFYETIYNAEDF